MDGIVLVLLGVLILIVLVYVFAYIFLCDKGMCTDEPDLHGRVYVVTGTTRGLGLVTVKRLARHGATVVMLNRNEKAGNETAASITEETGNDQIFNIYCDLIDLASVKAASEEVLNRWSTIDVLLCNAGIITTSLGTTVQGFEKHYGINFLSHFVLVNNLLPALKKSSQARLILMSSVGQWLVLGLNFDLLTFDDYKGISYNYMNSYCRSKLSMLIFAKECQRRYGSDNFVSVAAAPGVVLTDLWREISPFLDFLMRTFVRPVCKTVLQGAQSEITCCLTPYEKLVPGAYYDHRRPTFCHPQANKVDVGTRLWNMAFEHSREFLLNPELADPANFQKTN